MKRPSVLVVDDDEDIRHVIREVLESESCPVKQARNGEEALRAMRASKARLVVLLDLMMPRMGGKEVLEAMGAEPTLSRHVVILMTAARKTLPLALVQQMTALGVTIMCKPFDIGGLVKAVSLAAGRIGKK